MSSGSKGADFKKVIPHKRTQNGAFRVRNFANSIHLTHFWKMEDIGFQNTVKSYKSLIS